MAHSRAANRPHDSCSTLNRAGVFARFWGCLGPPPMIGLCHGPQAKWPKAVIRMIRGGSLLVCVPTLRRVAFADAVTL